MAQMHINETNSAWFAKKQQGWFDNFKVNGEGETL